MPYFGSFGHEIICLKEQMEEYCFRLISESITKRFKVTDSVTNERF